MNRKMGIRIFFFTTFILFASLQLPGYAAARVTTEEWSRLTSDKSFSYRDEKEVTNVPKVEVKSNALSSLLAEVLLFFTSRTGRLLIWVALLLFFIYVSYRIFQERRVPAPPLHKQPALSTESKGFPTQFGDNWKNQMEQAAADANYRLAIRFAFLGVLQTLDGQGLIRFTPEKTNQEYNRELSATNAGKIFYQLSRRYEQAWYGDQTVSVKGFREYMNLFESVKSELR